jgi:hypothetical protein
MNVIQRIASGRILALLRVPKEKPPEISDFRGSVVDKRFEISNLYLLKDIADYLNPKE